MARKKKNPGFPSGQELSSVQGLFYSAGLSDAERLIIGVGAVIFGYSVFKYAPKMADRVIPLLMSAFIPKQTPVLTYHPEGEPQTFIDEYQLGRSEVIREIANPKRN